ncbi:hypothetical protein LJC36_00975 [Desulfovibrio sp. OttesenSCG-928-C14]|nr:hypothetical protein [Desulfovibrio sp. OttesenSCG-928-O18]MDL2313535.1 hypothetical protein [Desulfovibrio sp. OttesenSCG-928-C14]
MKKQFLSISLLLSTLLLMAAAPAFAAMENSFVSVSVVTEETLGKYEFHHEFIEFKEKDYQKLVFQASVPLKSFTFIEIIRNDKGMPSKGRALYSLDALKPDKPFVVTWMEWGLLPHRGITFIDDNNATRCFFIGQSGDDGSMLLTEYPVSYQGVPGAYKPILDTLFLVEERLRQKEYDSEKDLKTIGFTQNPSPRNSALGYALADLNNDGVLELLLGSTDGLNDSAPNSIFTLKDGQPVLVASFWSRNRGIISGDGTIYTVGSGGASNTYLSSFTLDKNTGKLIQLTDIQSGYAASENKPYFIQMVDGKKHSISEQKFKDFHAMYENPSDRMYLAVPIVLGR